MKTTYKTIQANVDATDKRRRVQAGWQCPECDGVRITAQRNRFDAQPTGFVCDECGCQFGSK